MRSYMDEVARFRATEERARAGTEEGEAPVCALPPVHDEVVFGVRPTAPCAACGQVCWRVWCHDERTVWQWICNRCRPLVVINRDGTRWRS